MKDPSYSGPILLRSFCYLGIAKQTLISRQSTSGLESRYRRNVLLYSRIPKNYKHSLVGLYSGREGYMRGTLGWSFTLLLLLSFCAETVSATFEKFSQIKIG